MIRKICSVITDESLGQAKEKGKEGMTLGLDRILLERILEKMG